MNDGALVGGEFAEGAGKGDAEILFIGIGSGGEGRDDFGGELVAGLVAGAAAAHGIDGEVVGEADEKGAFIAGAAQAVGLAGQLNKNFLEGITGIGLVTRQVEEEGEQSSGVVVV